MLTKLLKYDFKALFKSLIPIYLVAFLISLLTRVFDFASTKVSLLDYPAGLIKGLTIIMIIGIPIATFIFSIIKYYNNMVKDEGYLTHTLPVKKSSLVLSKLITSTVAMGVSILVSIAVIFLAFNISDDIYKAFGELFDVINKYSVWIVPNILFNIILGYIGNMLLIYASISLGQKHNGNKAVYSVIYGTVMYNVTQIVSALVLFLPAIVDKNYMTKFEQEVPNANFLNGFMLYASIISIVICVAYYIISKKALEKKLNLD